MQTGSERHAAPRFALLALTGGLAILSSTLAKTPVLPLFARQLGASPWQIGWIIMASTLPGILISFPAGVLADRIGQERLLRAALWVFATAPWLYLCVNTPWQLTAVRFFHGFATAIFGTVVSALLAKRYVSDRAQRLATYSSVTIVGRSAAPFLGGALLSFASFDSVYLACAISGVLALMLGWTVSRTPATDMAPRAKPVESRSMPDMLRVLLGNRCLMGASLAEAAQYLSFGAVEAFLALYAAQQGLPAWQIGVILGVQLLGIVFIKPLMGRASDRVGRAQVILPGLLISALSLLVMAHMTGFYALTLVSLMYGIGFATVTSSTSALVADLTNDGAYGSSMGMLRTVMDIGQSIGPVLTGWVVGRFGYASAFTLLALILLAGAMAFAAVCGRGVVPR